MVKNILIALVCVLLPVSALAITIQVKRGPAVSVPATLKMGEIGVTTDTKQLFVGYSASKREVAFKDNAEYSNSTCTTSVSISPANGNHQKVTLGGNCTFSFTQPANGPQKVLLKVIQGSGSYTGTWTGVKWPGGTVPTLTTSNGGVDFISCYLDGTSAYCASAQAFQ